MRCRLALSERGGGVLHRDPSTVEKLYIFDLTVRVVEIVVPCCKKHALLVGRPQFGEIGPVGQNQ